MGYNFLLLATILVYFAGRAILSRMSQGSRPAAVGRSYFDAVYFIVVSFFCALSLNLNLAEILEGNAGSAVFWVHLATALLAVWIFLRMIRSTVSAVERCVHSEEEPYPVHTVIASVVRIVTAFSAIYFVIWVFNPTAFRGLENCTSLVEGYFDFIYFSFVTCATVGYGDISPASALAKVFVTVQIILFFVVFGVGVSYASRRKEKG